MNTFQLTKQRSTEFTLTVTLTLEDWTKVAECLQQADGVHAYPLKRVIDNLVSKATTLWWPDYKIEQDRSGVERTPSHE